MKKLVFIGTIILLSSCSIIKFGSKASIVNTNNGTGNIESGTGAKEAPAFEDWQLKMKECPIIPQPVCGKITPAKSDCKNTPCEAKFETFMNECFAKARNATDIYNGECKK